MNKRQERFAHEYSVDHNATQAAIRAGYSERTAAQSGARVLANVSVKQLVVKLDGEKNAALGVEGVNAVRVVGELLEEARVLQPKIWKGEPVTYTDPESGEERVAVEFVAAALAGRLAELRVRLAGLLEAKSSVAVFGEVVYKLTLDRDLSEEEG